MSRELLLQSYRLEAQTSAMTTTKTLPKAGNNNNYSSNICRRSKQHKSNSAQNLNELNATVNYIADDNYHQQQQQQQYNYQQHASGCIVRPMRLPLRKHHSFHFQPSQTVAGIKPCQLQQLREQLQQQQQQQLTAAAAATTQRGPLIFQPLTLNEQSAFKPIELPPPDVDVDDENGNDYDVEGDDDGGAATPTPLATVKIAYDKIRQHSWPPTSTETEVSNMTLQQRISPTGDSSNNCSDVEEVNDATAKTTMTLAATSSSNLNAFKQLQLQKRANVAASSIGSNLMLLHPAAASLEALEALSQVNSELLLAADVSGSSNSSCSLQQLQQQQMLARLRLKLQGSDEVKENATATAATEENIEEDDEDLGYSYCEDELDDELNDDDDDDDDLAQQHDSSLNISDDYSPNATVILTADSNGGQVKYVTMTKTYQEVHI